MTDKVRFPREVAMPIAEGIVYDLRPFCVRIEIAGSLRRQKADVGDIEILYIPVIIEEPDDTDLFATREADKAHDQIQKLERNGVLERRLSAAGHQAYGPKNKLLVHRASGIPVDLFAATTETWWNLLVCRTGPAELNQRIAAAAIAKGWHWQVYGPGFSRVVDGGEALPDRTETHAVISEKAVFDFVGLPYRDPPDRA
jgi:DNA polymerase/3'-5' exonuclease PolX